MQFFCNSVLPVRPVYEPGDLVLFRGELALVTGSLYLKFSREWLFEVKYLQSHQNYSWTVIESQIEPAEMICESISDCRECPLAQLGWQAEHRLSEMHLHANACPKRSVTIGMVEPVLNGSAQNHRQV